MDFSINAKGIWFNREELIICKGFRLGECNYPEAYK